MLPSNKDEFISFSFSVPFFSGHSIPLCQCSDNSNVKNRYPSLCNTVRPVSKIQQYSWAGWHTALIPALGRQSGSL